MMEDREKELRVAHYASDLPVSMETVAENKGNYSELMLWYSALFQFEMNDEETP